ncbi:Uncharacterized protein APZ42_003146, partial [Daphnia magna]
EELPVKTLEEFVSFENLLLFDERKRASLVRFVRNIGGATEGDSVSRAWKEVVSVEVRAQCNWNGVRRGRIKKHKLNKSPIVLAVWNGLRQNPACSNFTDAALQFETVKAFVRAAEATRRIAARAILLAEREADHNDEHNAEENI